MTASNELPGEWTQLATSPPALAIDPNSTPNGPPDPAEDLPLHGSAQAAHLPFAPPSTQPGQEITLVAVANRMTSAIERITTSHRISMDDLQLPA